MSDNAIGLTKQFSATTKLIDIKWEADMYAVCLCCK